MDRKPLYIGIIFLLCLVCAVFAWGGFQQIRFGNGFLLIPSHTLTPTATATSTNTSTLTPTLTSTFVATATRTPTATDTPLPTLNFFATEERIWLQVTQAAETAIYLQTPSSTPEVPDGLLQSGMMKRDEKGGTVLVYVRTNETSASTSMGFWMQSSEVSWEAYERCVLDHACSPLLDGTAGLPVVFITKSDSARFCEWLGMKLPSVDQYQIAARGLVPDPYRDNYAQINNGPVCERVDGLSFVYGNVWEWTESGELFGGSWKSSPQDVEKKMLAFMPSDETADDVGFRCVLENPLND